MELMTNFVYSGFFQDFFSNICTKFFLTVWNIESFFQIHDHVRYLLLWVETVNEKCFFNFSFPPMWLCVKKFPVYLIDFMVSVYNMLCNAICRGLILHCILMLIFAVRIPLLHFSQVNLGAGFTTKAIDHIFPYVLRAWWFEFTKRVI